jgi:hypothetical protein
MPSLVTAYVGLGAKCDDYCQFIGLHFVDDECSCHAYPVDEGELLHGLPNTANLELIAGYKIEMVWLHLLPFHSSWCLPSSFYCDISIHC